MKKVVSLILALITLLCCLTACGMGNPKIEDYEWRMRVVMSNDIELADSDEVVIAVERPDEIYPLAKIVELTLLAKEGKLTITDATNSKIYEGTYKAFKKTPEGTDYEITIDGKNGYATVAMTKYYDGTKEPTLPITLDEYSIYFYAN